MQYKFIKKSLIAWGIIAMAAGSPFAFAGHGHQQSSASGMRAHYGMESGTGETEHHGMGSEGWDGMHHYSGFAVELTDDVFISPARFRALTGGMFFPDDNGDGICDYVQNTASFAALNLGEFIDENGDGIYDPFQTREAYQALGMRNFVDTDGDGICDNYEGNSSADGSHIYCRYPDFQVDMSEDVFISPARFRALTGGMFFPDGNGDGICDYVQDTLSFTALNLGEFIDENGDGIYDPFETREAYHALGMKNFVDTDGDGLCDNYKWSTAVE